jgi:hypothetical protein
MKQAPKMPLSAVGMIAAHLFLERVKTENALPRDLDRICYGCAVRGSTYGDLYADQAAQAAWRIAAAVEAATPVDEAPEPAKRIPAAKL